MAVKIQRLVCNVAVVSSSGAAVPIRRRSAETISHEQDNQTYDGVSRSVSDESGHDRSEASGIAERHHEKVADPIDTRAIADRVYRLMRDELVIARERE